MKYCRWTFYYKDENLLLRWFPQLASHRANYSFIFVKSVFSVYFYDCVNSVHEYTNSHATEHAQFNDIFCLVYFFFPGVGNCLYVLCSFLDACH